MSMKNLPRWLFSSIAYHFEGIAAANNIPYFVEGIDERDDDNMQLSHVELRVTGPQTKEIAKGYYHVQIVINFMFTSLMDMAGSAYELVQWCGVLQDAMLEPIPIYKYGDGPDDTGYLIGCLRVKDGKYDAVKLYHFGQMSRTERIRQSELDAIFEFEVTNETLELGEAIEEGGVDPSDPLIILPPSSTMTLSDSTVIIKDAARTMEDDLALTSAADCICDFPRRVSHDLGLSSAAGLNATWVRSVSDTMNLTQNLEFSQSFDTTSSALALADAVIGAMERPRDLTHNTGLTDDVTATLNTPAFTFTINTERTGTSNSQQFDLPLESGGSYNFTVEWGDGDQDTITAYNDSDKLHTYASSGNYEVKIKQQCIGWRFNNGGDCQKMVNISEWGPLQIRNTGGAFHGCRYMTVNASDSLTFNGDSMSHIFSGCDALTDPDFSNWDTSGLTSFRAAFYGCDSFNGNVSSWNTHNATTMYQMFFSCDAFNPSSLNSWNTHNVNSFYAMFDSCNTFNADITGWNTHNANEFGYMFKDCFAFNRDIGSWNTVNATDIDHMFQGASSFNQDLSSWNTVKVTDMEAVFHSASSFNGDIDSWNTHNVTRFDFFAYNATAFNRDLSSWNTNNATRFYYMFNNSAANFDAGGWDIGSLTSATLMWNGSDLDTTNYDALLIGWGNQSHQSSVQLGIGSTKYSAGAATTARGYLTSNSWSIADGGQVT